MSELKPGSRGPASLIYFHFGDNYFTTLAQEAGVNLNLAIKGSKKSIVLKDGSNLLVKAALDRKPDAAPTKDNFLKYARQLADEGYFLDIYVFAHGSSDTISMPGADLDGSDIEHRLGSKATGYERFPIRMVYQMNCYGQTLNDSWLGIGAKTVGGARYVNFYPNQFNLFAQAWNKGSVSFRNAWNGSNTSTTRTVVQTFLVAAALASRKKWGGCPFGETVLGKKSCAKNYFEYAYRLGSDWQAHMSGKENMNYSSFKILEGTTSVTKESELSWT